MTVLEVRNLLDGHPESRTGTELGYSRPSRALTSAVVTTSISPLFARDFSHSLCFDTPQSTVYLYQSARHRHEPHMGALASLLRVSWLLQTEAWCRGIPAEVGKKKTSRGVSLSKSV